MTTLSNGSSTIEPRPLPPPSSSSTSKISQVLRRTSTIDSNNEKRKEKERDTRRSSIPEPERRSSLASLPLRLRRKKTQPVVEHSEEELEAAERLGRLFFSLPSEIVSQIITHLTLGDIYTLRLTSRIFTTILNYNTLAVTRSILPQCLPELTTLHIQTHLYPATTRTSNLSDLFTTLRRQTLLTRQINNLLAFVQMKSYMTRTATRVLSVADNRLRLTHAFTRPAWYLTHFLESYRHTVLSLHPNHSSHPALTNPSTISLCPQCLTHLHSIIASYPDSDILPTYHFHLLSMEHLQIATRAPSAAGPLERRLRGWRKLCTTDENVNLAIFVVLGGIGPLGRVAMMQGSYASRVAVMGDFVDRVWAAVAENERSAGAGNTNGNGNEGVGNGVGGGSNSNAVIDTLEPPWMELTKNHIASLPDVSTFFYDVWKERIDECASDGQDVHEPYSWLQRAMEGSGLAFGQLRIPEPPLALGASPL